MQLNEQRARIRTAVAAIWATSRRQSIVELIEDNFRLSPEFEADPGPVDFRNNPYWRLPIELANDPNVRRWTILKSTQVGGTLMLYALMYGFAILDPSPSMIVYPTRDEASAQRDRIYANGSESKSLFSLLVPPKRNWNMQKLRMGPQIVNIAWAGSKQRLRGKPCKRVWKTETDVYPESFNDTAGDPHKASDERVKRFFDYFIGEESTPAGTNSYIYQQWSKETTRRYRYHCPCPHCGLHQELRFFPHKSGPHAGCGGFGGIFDSNGETREVAEVRRGAHYICLKGCKIKQNFKNQMVSKGKWVAEGQTIDDDGEIHGEPDQPITHVAFHIWTMHQATLSMGAIAAEYVQRRSEGKLREFYQDWLGLRFETRTRMPKYEVLGDKFRNDSYSFGHIPQDVWFLTAGVDVQLDLLYWGLFGWAPFREPFLIDLGKIHRDPDADEFYTLQPGDRATVDEQDIGGIKISGDLAQLPALVFQRRWPVMNGGLNQTGLKLDGPRLSGIDTNYRNHEVHDFTRTYKNRVNVLRCLRGDDNVKTDRFKPSVIEKSSRDGKPYPGGLKLWRFNKTLYQESTELRIEASPGQPGAFNWPTDIMPRGRQLLRQFVNVRRDLDGKYQKITEQIGEDYRDVFCIAECCADMVMDCQWSPEAFAAKTKKKTRQARQSTILER